MPNNKLIPMEESKMRHLISSLIAATLLFVTISCREGSEPVRPSSADHPIVGTTLTAGSDAMAFSTKPSLLKSGETAQTSLIGTYRFETQYEFDNFFNGQGHPLSETAGRAFTSDYGAGMAIDVNNAENGEVLKWEYLDPKGSIYGVRTITYNSETDCWVTSDRMWCGDPENPYLDDIRWIHIMFINENLPLGIWTINFYDNGVLRFTEQFELVQSPSLEIVDAKMITPTELGIGVRVTFPDYGQETTRKVRFTAVINGCPVDKTIDITQKTEPGEEWSETIYHNFASDTYDVLPTTPLKIDLTDPDGDQKKVVSRFTKNESFILSGEAVCEFLEDDPIKSLQSQFNVEILLPVVILHGYIHPSGYPVPWWQLGPWVPWESAYKNISQVLQNEGYEKEETYDNYPGYTKYRTLWDPQYGEMYRHPKYTSAAGIEDDITDLLNNVWKLNYASKVNFVGHSFGGLVARYYADKNRGSVNTVITVGSPHLGTTVFYVDNKRGYGVFLEYSSLSEVEDDLEEWAALRWVIPRYDCLDLKEKGSVTDLDPLTISSLFSNTLDVGMAYGVSYHCIYSTEHNTDRDLVLVKTQDWYKQQGKIVRVPGDGYITSESAGAFGTPFAVSGKGSEHAELMNHVLVQDRIVRILKPVP